MGHYDLDYEMEDELRNMKKDFKFLKKEYSPEFDITCVGYHSSLGNFYVIENESWVGSFLYREDGSVEIHSTGAKESVTDAIEAYKVGAQMLEAFQKYLGDS